jgi:hypothetical protein
MASDLPVSFTPHAGLPVITFARMLGGPNHRHRLECSGLVHRGWWGYSESRDYRRQNDY